LDVHLNGQIIPSLSGDDITSIGFLLVNGPEDEITWSLREAGSWPEGYSSHTDDLRFTSLKYIPIMPGNTYREWLYKFNNLGHLFNEVISLEGDANKDGINNYLSFLLDKNPFEPIVLLGILPASEMKGDSPTLWHPTFPEDLADSFVIEYTRNLNEDWHEASTILGDPYSDPGNPEITLCDILLEKSSEQPFFFRIRYTEAIPDISSLLFP